MARVVNKLNPSKVSGINEPGYYGDGDGLWLQVSKTGSKSWILRFKISGKPREMGLGAVNVVPLSQARMKAKEYRSLLLEGKDPLEVRNAARQAEALRLTKIMTFDQCAAAYIEAHRSSWKNPKHAGQWVSTLKTYASPTIGNLSVTLIDTALVIKVLSPIWTIKNETAMRLRGRIESVLDWAAAMKHRQGENPARWRGHLDNLLSDPSRNKRVEHHPALPWQQTGTFMSSLKAQEGIAARALEFVILTAVRSGEVRFARWSEFDLDAALWVIPGERMKAGREHRVPLSSRALDLLRSTPRIGDFVFPGMKPGRPLSDMSLTAVLRRMNGSKESLWADADGKHITVHGFRSSFREWCSESVANSFPREVCEHALAHSLPDKVEAAYRRGDLLEKRVMLMQAWADYCGTIPTAANVTQIRGAAPTAA